jgi:hypothetical protein
MNKPRIKFVRSVMDTSIAGSKYIVQAVKQRLVRCAFIAVNCSVEQYTVAVFFQR